MNNNIIVMNISTIRQRLLISFTDQSLIYNKQSQQFLGDLEFPDYNESSVDSAKFFKVGNHLDIDSDNVHSIPCILINTL
jgi:hypothetical protein